MLGVRNVVDMCSECCRKQKCGCFVRALLVRKNICVLEKLSSSATGSAISSQKYQYGITAGLVYASMTISCRNTLPMYLHELVCRRGLFACGRLEPAEYF